MLQRLSCPTVDGFIVPSSGIEPKCPALEDRFLTIHGLPGKSLYHILFTGEVVLRDLADQSVIKLHSAVAESLKLPPRFYLLKV